MALVPGGYSHEIISEESFSSTSKFFRAFEEPTSRLDVVGLDSGTWPVIAFICLNKDITWDVKKDIVNYIRLKYNQRRTMETKESMLSVLEYSIGLLHDILFDIFNFKQTGIEFVGKYNKTTNHDEAYITQIAELESNILKGSTSKIKNGININNNAFGINQIEEKEIMEHNCLVDNSPSLITLFPSNEWESPSQSPHVTSL